MTILWTLDGDKTSWATWAESMVDAPVSVLVESFIPSRAAQTGSLALDIGCGTGRAFFPLTRAGYRVIGLDPTAAAVGISRQKAFGTGVEAALVQASGSHLPFPRKTASFVFAAGVLFHLSEAELRNALIEIDRVLQPGGEAVLHFLDIDDWRRSLALSIQSEDAPVPSFRAVVTCFCSEDEIRRLITGAGLKIVTMEMITSSGERGEQRNWFARYVPG